MDMAEADRSGGGDADEGLLTPAEREMLRETRLLRQRSGRLIERSRRATRPKEFLHRFPPPPGDSPDRRK